jgi:hypothetical protein|tara:strand:+ start:39 stop:884 length:846 start_codon:yes stop_codon:yes gene_type:complete
MKKKFDVDKFIKVLLTPKKYPKWYDKKGKPIIDYPNEFGLDTKKFCYKLREIYKAVEDAGYKELTETITTKDEDEHFPFYNIDKLDEDFARLDKSFNYSPIFHLRDTPEPDDGSWFYLEEYAYLSTKKSKYSFLLGADDYNTNPNLYVIKVFKNIKKKDIRILSNIALEKNLTGTLGKDSHYCQWIFLNNAYIWGSESEYKALMSKRIFPQSLKKHFLPIVENKIKFSKECGNKPSDIKKINSMIAILNESRIKKKTWRPFNTWSRKSTKPGKGEVWEFVK